MKSKLYYVAVALVFVASAVIFAARSGKQAGGFVLHQRGYQFDAKGVASLNYTSDIYYRRDGSTYEVKRFTNGLVHRDLRSAEDGAWYRVTKERIYRRGDYAPNAAMQFTGEPVDVAGISAIRVQPKDDRTGKPYVVADVAPGLQNAIVGIQAFNENGQPVDRVDTVSVEYTDPPAELFKLPAGVPVESVPSPFEQK